MSKIEFDGVINILNLGMDYIYTPVNIHVELNNDKNQIINIIERKKVIILVEEVITDYMKIVRNTKENILEHYKNYNDLFLSMFKCRIKELDFLKRFDQLVLTVGNHCSYSVDGITSTPQYIDI